MALAAERSFVMAVKEAKDIIAGDMLNRWVEDHIEREERV